MKPCDGGCGPIADTGGSTPDRYYTPPPPPRHHCGWTCSAGNFWNKHKAVIVNVTVTIVVTAGCEVATGGAGSIGCAVVGGMAGNYAGYAVSTPANQQSLGGAFKAEAIGALQGAASWGIGKASGALLGKLASTAGGRVAAKLASKAGSDADSAVGKVASRAGSGGEDAADSGAGRAAVKAAPHEAPSEPASAPAGCNSFVPGTKVLLAGGKTKKIEDVKVGDKVIATDPVTGKTRLEPVIAAFGGTSYKNLIQITVDTDGTHGHHVGVITATEHHKFWDSTHHQWLRADQLTRGTTLRTPTGAPVRVISAFRSPGHPTVRDLTIANDHTYYVEAGTTPVLVHNCAASAGGGKSGFFNRIFGKKQPEPPASNGTVGGLRGIPHDNVDLADNWVPDQMKRGIIRSLSDDDLLKSVFAPDDGIHMTFYDDIMMEGNHRMAELLRRADDPMSRITNNTPIYVDGW